MRETPMRIDGEKEEKRGREKDEPKREREEKGR